MAVQEIAPVPVRARAGALRARNRNRAAGRTPAMPAAPAEGVLRHATRLAAAFLGVVVAVAGCGKTPPKNGQDIGERSSGAMEIISKEPVHDFLSPNLIKNGDFEEWLPGAPAPVGFFPPSPPGVFSSLQPETKQVAPAFPQTAPASPQTAPASPQTASGRLAVRQTWVKGRDDLEWFYNLFHAQIGGLSPSSEYRITVQALNLSSGAFQVLPIQAWSAKPGTPGANPEFKVLSWDIVVQPREGFQECSGEFTTLDRNDADLYLAICSSSKSTQYPATVIWDDFELHLVTE